MTDIKMTSCHAEGEVGNVITGGVTPPPGDTLWQMRDWLEADGTLWRTVLNEPRGGVFKHVNLLVPPKVPRAAMGFLIMEPAHCPPMSGSNAMCVATVCLEMGLVPMQDPQTVFHLEAPAGLVKVTAQCRDGKALSVTINNVASFADKLSVPLEVDGLPTLTIDTAFGGDSFAIVDAAALGLALTPDEGRDIAEMGAKITKAANAQIGFSHPDADWDFISFTEFSGPLTQTGTTLTGKNAVVIDPGKIDRSPCGTGSSAKMAVLAARAQMTPGMIYKARSIIGGTFTCTFDAGPDLGNRPTILPRLTGRAWITGQHVLTVHPDDPWPTGYRVADTWPGA